ncbi:hypothetical protein LCGC14_2406150 [marine sediment metagenome]|uniref:Uncharacterized protein n=1 Tax=marine sediment metagenome TaxID=412755 RepID=A0A0F9ENB3_9ZZZZ
MSCKICGRNNCTESFHSLEEQNRHEDPEKYYESIIQAENEGLKKGIRKALNEIGKPSIGYPSPIANAYDILNKLFNPCQEAGKKMSEFQQPLYDLIHKAHNVILLESELQHIEDTVLEMYKFKAITKALKRLFELEGRPPLNEGEDQYIKDLLKNE